MLITVPFTLPASQWTRAGIDPNTRKNITMMGGYGFRIACSPIDPGEWPIALAVKDRKSGQEQTLYIDAPGWYDIPGGFRSIDVLRIGSSTAGSWYLTVGTDPGDFVTGESQGSADLSVTFPAASGGDGTFVNWFADQTVGVTTNDPITATIASDGGLDLTGVSGIRVGVFGQNGVVNAQTITSGTVRLWHSIQQEFDPAFPGPTLAPLWALTTHEFDLSTFAGLKYGIFEDMRIWLPKGRLYAETRNVVLGGAGNVRVYIYGVKN